MKKIITLMMAILAIALVSCGTAETKKEEIKVDSTAVKIDSTVVKIDTVAKVDTCKKICKKMHTPKKK